MDLRPYLDDLESRIDERVEAELWDQWLDFCHGRFEGEVFTPRRPGPRPPAVAWPKILVNEALRDPEAMVLRELAACSGLLADGAGLLMAVRANYGTPIVPSLWGAEIVMMDEELDCLPCSRPLGREGIEALADAGVPDLDGGLGRSVFAMGRRFRETLDAYPKMSRWVTLYHPDMQGPMDICEMLWGSSVFYDLVDRPKLVHAVLETVTETYAAFMRRWRDVAGPGGRDGASVHWSMMHRGTLMLRDDSAMNLSPAMFDEFIRPYDQRLLAEFGGGAIHACGRVEHYVDRLGEMPGVTAFQMSQPEMNDMETVYRHTVDRGIPLLGLSADAVAAARAAGRPLRGQVFSR